MRVIRFHVPDSFLFYNKLSYKVSSIQILSNNTVDYKDTRHYNKWK